ncbi:MAG TPA: shikimate dehydrogenase [Solirubrobacterales bacterium]|jgi:shikimate dehydrogenase|nr:shikimate dehydrogenase [Solirubrobacterales bacterium]
MPRLAVLGHPVAHSRSPVMQNAALAALGLGEEWSYEAIDVAPEEFEVRVRAMAAEGFAGVNVTVPHKLLALALADVASEMAEEIGAANTLIFRANGIEAQNTDAGGLIASLPRPPRGQRALVLGAGGAARAAVWGLGAAGATVEIWNRTVARAETVRLEVTQRARELQIEVEVTIVQAEVPGEEADATLDQSAYELIVNTTAVGLQGEEPFEHLPLRRDGFRPGQVVVDMVYGDRPSTLLEAAAAAGAATVDGIEVLVQQGALSFEIWTGHKPPLDVMRSAARA